MWLGVKKKNHIERLWKFSGSNYKPKRSDSSRSKGKSSQQEKFQMNHPGKPNKRSVKCKMLTESD